MIALRFDGWAECRLATDPDPSDEPRGVSGWTFAVAGEPDLDRIIRMQPSRAVARALAPPIGVTVRAVSVDGEPVSGHPLLGAAVDLLDDPVFEGRNGIVSEDAEEPIFPFHLAIRGADGLVLQREHRDLTTGELVQEPPVGFADAGADLTAALGGLSPPEFRAARRAKLEELRAKSVDEVEQAALDKRIADIATNLGDGIAFGVLGFALRYRIVLEGPWGVVRDPAAALGGVVGMGSWIADLWFGAFDADTLCTFVKGTIELPFSP